MTISRETMIEIGAESVINARDFCVSKKREIEVAKEACLEQGFEPDPEILQDRSKPDPEILQDRFEPDPEILQDIMKEADNIWNQNRYQAMAEA